MFDKDLPGEEHRDLMTVEHWLECVAEGGFIDYDGLQSK